MESLLCASTGILAREYIDLFRKNSADLRRLAKSIFIVGKFYFWKNRLVWLRAQLFGNFNKPI